MIGTHQSKAEPWMLRNAMTDVDRMGLLFRFKSVEKSLTSISRAMDDHLPTFSRYKTHTASRPCVLTAIFRRSISSCEVFWSSRLRISKASRHCVETCNIVMSFHPNVCESISNPNLAMMNPTLLEARSQQSVTIDTDTVVDISEYAYDISYEKVLNL